MKHPFAASSVALLLATTCANAEPTRLLDANGVEWETTPEGVALATLQGDRFAEPYQALVSLPSGTTSPLHVKSANMYGGLKGKMIHYVTGESPQDARRMGPGSFYAIARGTAHISACVSATPCIAYLYQDGAFDFDPVQP